VQGLKLSRNQWERLNDTKGNNRKRECIIAELCDLNTEFTNKRKMIEEKLRSLQKSCPHENVSYRGGGFWCKDCDYSR